MRPNRFVSRFRTVSGNAAKINTIKLFKYCVFAIALLYLVYFSRVVGTIKGPATSTSGDDSAEASLTSASLKDESSSRLIPPRPAPEDNARGPLRAAAAKRGALSAAVEKSGAGDSLPAAAGTEAETKQAPSRSATSRVPMRVVKSGPEAALKKRTRKPFKALIFTMDSLSTYQEASKRGGPAGEILIRECLQRGLRSLGGQVTIASTDEEFARLTGSEDSIDAFDLFFLDPWTAFGAGWEPRPFLAGRERRSFLLSFFGMLEAGHGLALPPSNILTPYPLRTAFPGSTPSLNNSFLGYFMYPKHKGTVTVARDDFAGSDPSNPGLGVFWQQREAIEKALMSLGFGLEDREKASIGLLDSRHQEFEHEETKQKKTVLLTQSAAGGSLSAESLDGIIPGTPVPAVDSLPPTPQKRNQGVVWGKKASYFDERKWRLLERLALNTSTELHFTLPAAEFPSWLSDPSSSSPAKDLFKLHGHLTKEEWNRLLGQSKFMLGLGDPLSGPSAVDAVSSGAVFLNPHYAQPKEQFFTSQHPFLEEAVGRPYVCPFSWELLGEEHVFVSLRKCVLKALKATAGVTTPSGAVVAAAGAGGAGGLPPLIPLELTEPVYLKRLRRIVGPALGWPSVEEEEQEEAMLADKAAQLEKMEARGGGGSQQ